jgi:hypothetical protein
MNEFEPPEDPEEPEALEVTIHPEWEPGVYANASMVSFTPREFTIDFIRIRPRQTSGVLVARVSCSSRAADARRSSRGIRTSCRTASAALPRAAVLELESQ